MSDGKAWQIAVERFGTLALLERAPLDARRQRRLDRIRSGLVLRWADHPEWRNVLAGADGYVTVSGRVDEKLLGNMPGLRFVQFCGSLDHDIDVDACTARGVVVSRLRLLSTRSVAEHVIMLMLAVTHRLGPLTAALHGWVPAPHGSDPPVPYVAGCYNWLGMADLGTLEGRRLGILGFGDVGAEVARLARGLGMRISYLRRNRLPPPEERRLGVSFSPLDELIAASDVLTLHVRRTPETLGLISRDVIRRMPRGGVLIDTTRGGIVDHQALAEALRDGHLMGAGVDVFPEEPVSADNPLLGCPSALLTPHCAGGSLDLFLREAEVVLGNVRRGLNGGRVRGILNKPRTRG